MAGVLMLLVLSLSLVMGSATLFSGQEVLASPPTQDVDEAAVLLLPRARSILEDNLVDYGSARLRHFRAVRAPRVYYSDGGNPRVVPFAHRGEETVVFCGEINSRNRMGGYTGWTRVLIQPEEPNWKAFIAAGARRGDEELRLMCSPGAEGAVEGNTDYSTALSPEE